MKTGKFFCVVALFCGAFVSAQATNVCVTSDAMGIEEVLQKKKGNPEEKMKKKVQVRVEQVAASVDLTQDEKDFLLETWLNADKERAAVSRDGKTPEELKAERGKIGKKYNKLLTDRFGKERMREINKAAKGGSKKKSEK